MSEVDKHDELLPTGEDLQIDERESLKNKLTILGISYQNNAPTAKLRQLLEEFAEQDQHKEHEPDVPTAPSKRQLVLDATKLVRVTVISNDPTKKEYQGELFTVGNSVIGTIRKFVPFGRPWLIPQILLNVIEEREFQLFELKRTADGGQTRIPRTLKAYNVIRHELPTAEELAELAKSQALRSAGETA